MTAHPTDTGQPSPDWRAEIEIALGELRAADDLIRSAFATMREAQAAVARSVAAVRSAVEAAKTARIEPLPTCDVPITEHRAAHRFGRPARLDVDAELRAFVLSRIERLTYPEIEAEIARHFPPARRIRKSALQAWWSKRRAADHG